MSNDDFFNQNEKRISDLNELVSTINEYLKLCEKFELLSEIEKMTMYEKINKIKATLRRGVKLNNEFISKHIEEIKKFVSLFEMVDYESVTSKLKSIDLTLSPVKLLENGKLCSYGSFISIDYSYATFDENGNFVGLNEPKPNFFKHTIIHELLHIISNKGLNYMDSFSEGMTDYFAHKISKATNIVSDSYGYIERVFYIIGSLMGDDLLFQDYATDMYKMENLHKFMQSLGISGEELKAFKKDLDTFLSRKMEKNENNQELELLKNKIDNFILTRIIIPYYSCDKESAIKIMNKFFSDSEEVTADLCEIHFSSSDKKVKS